MPRMRALAHAEAVCRSEMGWRSHDQLRVVLRGFVVLLGKCVPSWFHSASIPSKYLADLEFFFSFAGARQQAQAPWFSKQRLPQGKKHWKTGRGRQWEAAKREMATTQFKLNSKTRPHSGP